MRSILIFLLLLLTGSGSQAQHGSWKHVSVGDSLVFSDAICFADSLHGFLVGCKLDKSFHGRVITYRTADGGRTWSAQPVAHLARSVSSSIRLQAIDSNTLFAQLEAGGYTLLGTHDAGQTWQALDSLPNGANYSFWSATGGLRYTTSIEITTNELIEERDAVRELGLIP